MSHDTEIEIETLKTEEIKNMGMGSKDQEGIPVPLHSFSSSIVRFLSFITEFQNKYLLEDMNMVNASSLVWRG